MFSEYCKGREECGSEGRWWVRHPILDREAVSPQTLLMRGHVALLGLGVSEEPIWLAREGETGWIRSDVGALLRDSPESWSGKKCLQRYSCLATIYVHSHTHKLTCMHTHTLPDTKAVGPQSLLRLMPRHVYHGRAESMELTVPESPFP